MNIALIAHDKKKDLMVDFCIAYSAILKKHHLCATNNTGTRLSRLCDVHNVPLATNIATAEVLIMGIERGDLDWRELVKPKVSHFK